MLKVPVVQPNKKINKFTWAIITLIYYMAWHGQKWFKSLIGLTKTSKRVCYSIVSSSFLSSSTSLKWNVCIVDCSAEFDLATCVVCLLYVFGCTKPNQKLPSSPHFIIELFFFFQKRKRSSFFVITINSFESRRTFFLQLFSWISIES